MIRSGVFFIGIWLMFISGCLYTTHNYHTGRVLRGGQSDFSFGYGRQALVKLECEDNQNQQAGWSAPVRKEGKVRCRHIAASTSQKDTLYSKPRVKKRSIPSISFEHRLGVRNRWGPFPGVEIGYHIELPTGPISAEFYTRLALPRGSWTKTRHSIALGFIIGFWADNSYYLGYAVSRKFGLHLFYASYRGMLMATQMAEVYRQLQKDEIKLSTHRRFVQQATLGYMWHIPNLIIIPDYVTPQISILHPKIPVTFDPESYGYDDGGVNFKWNVGFGWRF